jgi:hypothetical protein
VSVRYPVGGSSSGLHFLSPVVTGRSLEDKRNVPATIERILVRKSFSRVYRTSKSRDPPGTLDRYGAAVEQRSRIGPVSKGKVPKARSYG